MKTPSLAPVALIAGPTASGKSALALALAEATGGTIINADASQVYKDLRVLSARPQEAELARAPHRLFGHVDAAQPHDAAIWVAESRAAIEAVHAAAGLPILVGGTGLYIRSLLEGIAPIPPIDPAIRAQVRSLPVAEAHDLLAREDPPSAARLRPTDTTRVARALEVIRSTGRPIGRWQDETQGGIAERIRLVPLLLLPPRDWLHNRIAERFTGMLAQGAIEEVAALLARGLDPALPAMRAIGVAEIGAMLAGTMTPAAATEAAIAATRRYAKRQSTWFRHQPPADWPRHQEQLDDAGIADCVIKLHNLALTGSFISGSRAIR